MNLAAAILLGALAGYVAPDGRTGEQLIAAHVLPDPATTPGVLNPAVTPATIRVTICRARWTATIRPPTAYTDKGDYIVCKPERLC